MTDDNPNIDIDIPEGALKRTRERLEELGVSVDVDIDARDELLRDIHDAITDGDG